MMIRGVLGGSFDPVHRGHLEMARFVLERGLCEVLHVVPAWCSPHKSDTVASPGQRLAMVQLAFTDIPDLLIDARELGRAEPSYTIDTLVSLHQEFPRDHLLLVMGADSLQDFPRWKDPEGIARLASLAVLSRRSDSPAVKRPRTSLPRELRVVHYPDFHQPVASRDIRAMLQGTREQRAQGLEQVPPPVAAYIQQENLYRD
jgi:nicotinate-nucleotide adenylyltransferase|nr:nicotinate (nicotinamide) nucleotide adenylyltransferase [Candidatus Krumholzibacteria bacterium]